MTDDDSIQPPITHKSTHNRQMRGEDVSFGLLLSSYTKSRVGRDLKYPTFLALANAIGVDEETLRRWRFCRTIPASNHLLMSLCDALSLPIGERNRLKKQWNIEDSRREERRNSKLVGKSSSRHLYPAFASYEEIEDIVSLGQSLLGDGITIGPEPLQRHYQINPNIITILRDKEGRLVAYYLLYPLKELAYKEIMISRITEGSGIEDHHIDSSFLTATAIYIV